MLLSAFYFGVTATIGFSIFTILAILIMSVQGQDPEEIVNIIKPSASLAVYSLIVTMCLFVTVVKFP